MGSPAPAGSRFALAALLVLTVACSGGDDPTLAPSPSTAASASAGASGGAEPSGAGAGTDAATGPASTETAVGLDADPDGGVASPSEGAGATTATAYLVRDAGGRLWVEPVRFDLDGPTSGVAAASVQLALAGPEVDDLDRLTGPDVELLGADIDGTTLAVDLSGAVRDARLGAEAEATFQQVLAHTGAQFDTVDRVQLLVDGAPVSDLWGHVDWSEPFEPDPFAVTPVTIDSPERGTEVEVGPLSTTGTANTFEATVVLRLVDAAGTVVEEGFATASCGTGCRGTWEHVLDIPGPGTWTIEAEEPDPSGGEGRPPVVVRRTVLAS